MLSTLEIAERLAALRGNNQPTNYSDRVLIPEHRLLDFNFGQWLFSCTLNVISGYGDRPGSALRTYIAIILVFAGIYFGITNFDIFASGSQPLHWYEAIVLSLTSFHGRGFFPQLTLGDPIVMVAVLEAVVGLFIELVLIATFTRRLFDR